MVNAIADGAKAKPYTREKRLYGLFIPIDPRPSQLYGTKNVIPLPLTIHHNGTSLYS